MAYRRCAECWEDYSWESGRFSKTQWNKGEYYSRCKACVSRSGSVGGATGDGWGGFETVRNNATERYATSAGDHRLSAEVYDGRVYAQGAFKNVFMGMYTAGSRRGEDCVFKKFKPRVAHRADYFDKDVKAAEKASKYIDLWNHEKLTRLKVRINVPEVTRTSNGTKWLLEPFVHNWTKFNSNSGWAAERDDVDAVMQALSHFSYHVSGGKHVVCDLQGGLYKDGVILSDPIILSREAEQFGGGDLGSKGISTFFSRHECGEFCDYSWRRPRDEASYFEEHSGSSLLGNRGVPTTALLHTLAPLDEYYGDEYYDSDASSDDW